MIQGSPKLFLTITNYKLYSRERRFFKHNFSKRLQLIIQIPYFLKYIKKKEKWLSHNSTPSIMGKLEDWDI